MIGIRHLSSGARSSPSWRSARAVAGMVGFVSITVELSNLGPLRSAELELSDLVLLIGENNSGKTFLATVVHRVLDATPSRPWDLSRKSGDVPPLLRDWLRTVSDGPDERAADSDIGPPRLDDDSRAWATEIATEALTLYGSTVRDSIAYAFGAEASRLRRRTRSRHASDCYLRVRSSTPAWEVEIRFDSDRVTATPPAVDAWLASALDPGPIRHAIRRWQSVRRPSGLRASDLGRMLVEQGRLSAPEALFGSWPSQAIHLPADRTGIMQSHNVLAGAAVRQSARAGIRPIEIETLPGTLADFLSLILEVPETFARRGPQSPHASVVRRFEEDMRAEIGVDKSSDGQDVIVARTSEGQFPMARSSSMLSELAPLLLVLKSPFLYVDQLTIDEPEAHLHPEMQIRLASFLAELVNSGLRVVLTTHSDFFVTQFNNMMRLAELSVSGETSRSYDLPELERSKVRALRFRRENGWCTAHQSVPDAVDGVDESTFTDVMRSQYDETARLVNGLIEAGIQ